MPLSSFVVAIVVDVPILLLVHLHLLFTNTEYDDGDDCAKEIHSHRVTPSQHNTHTVTVIDSKKKYNPTHLL